jgi:two-component system, OmpR family, phosphate regulon response regulator PhoB
MEPLILIVEDDAALAELLRYNLARAGFAVDTAADGAEGLLKARERPPALIVLDWMLPEVSGIEVCRHLRRDARSRAIPILMLTAKGEVADRVRGLEAGADDYLAKPFSPAELVARVRAVLRRAQPAVGEPVLSQGRLVMDVDRHVVRHGQRELPLGPTEFRLLRHFLAHPGRVFSREQLLDRVWGHDAAIEPRTVDVHVRRLRRAFAAGGVADPIRTVRSAGYALQAQAD